VARHRVAVALALAFLNAAPAMPDDRQLLHASTNTNVLVILDSSSSMMHDFTDNFDLPAYMDDFVYPEGTVAATNGSKFGVAKSVLRQVITETKGVNWAFASYRNPNPTFGAASVDPATGQANGGARLKNETLENGGLEWLYVANCRLADTAKNCEHDFLPIDDLNHFPCKLPPIIRKFDCYADIQPGRFLQLGHKVTHEYNREDTGELADTLYPYTSSSTRNLPPAGVPNPANEPLPGYFRGAFGPNPSRHGVRSPADPLLPHLDTYADSGLVVYRNPSKPGLELRLKVVSGNYGDENLIVAVEEFKAPPVTQTPTPTATPITPTDTPTNTPTLTNTPSQTPTTRTPTPTTRTPTPSNTPMPTITPTFTNTPTSTNTPTVTPSNTPTPTPTFTITPTLVPTLPAGRFPAGSLLPEIARWLSPAVRGLLALAPPPPPPPFPAPGTPCRGIPSGLLTDTLNCGRCVDLYHEDYRPLLDFWAAKTPYNAGNLVAPTSYNGFAYRAQNPGTSANLPTDVPPGLGEPHWPAKLSATVSDNSPGCNTPGHPQCIVWKAEPEPLCGFIDDGHGNPDLVTPETRNPLPLLDRGFDDPQADPDPTFIWSGKAIYISYKRADLWNFPNPAPPKDPLFPYQTYADDTKNGNPPWGSQSPNDMDADGLSDPASPTLTDRHNRGAYAAFYNFDRYEFAQQSPNDAVAEPSHPLPAPAPCNVYAAGHLCGGLALFDGHPHDVANNPYVPYPTGPPPPAPEYWPLVPFPRDWSPFSGSNPGSDANSVTAIKRLLRFASSIVSFDSGAVHMSEYQLAEDAGNVVVMAAGTPIAGSLRDAYNYFKNSVQAPSVQDPFAACRLYKVVLITDGLDNSGADSCSGGSGDGPAGDLKTIGVPVTVVALVPGPSLPANLKCIADKSGGQGLLATDRASLLAALQNVVQLKRSVNFFAAPALPAFVSSSGDTAIIGGVIPSHDNLPPAGDGLATSWAIWNGSLKAYKLDSKGNIPTITATPVGFPDESAPDNTDETVRRPVWDAARVLGYTDPATTLLGQKNSALAGSDAPAISVWPGRKMVWGDGTGPTVPLTRKDFMPNSGNCTGTNPNDCFADLMLAMGFTDPTDATQQKNAVQTVQFLRGGKTTTGSRDEILNDLGTYGAVSPKTRYSYVYQDDLPPGNVLAAPYLLPQYSHKLGDIFHSEAAVLLPPKFFQFLSGNVTPRTGACGTLTDCSYGTFAAFHSKRRKVVFVGTNDGFLHAFDAGVWGRDTVALHNLLDTFDFGTGREIFAYAPKALMNPKFPNLLNFSPQPQYFVDGSPVLADVFIGPTDTSGKPVPADRTWKTVLVSGLRQGGHHYFALDVTQPDLLNADGTKKAPVDGSPDCLDDGVAGCAAPYPTVLWETTDACTIPTECVTNMGETWSRPVVGRIKVSNGTGSEDRYVAIFGGGFDASFVPGQEVSTTNKNTTTQGRAIYIVNVETGQRIYKATEGLAAGGSDPVLFAPMPAAPAVADVNDDGYLDVAYIGDLNGRMWRLDLTTGVCGDCDTTSEALTFPQPPFLLYDSLRSATGPPQKVQPIFLDAGIIFISGGVSPTLGVAFGTGYRAELLENEQSINRNRFHFVIDPGTNVRTFHDTDLVNITPVTGTGPAPTRACTADSSMTNCGYFLDFATANEKAVSTVFSTLGVLSLVTFSPNSPTSTDCETGTSFRYRFLFGTGQGGYNVNPLGVPGALTDYQQVLGSGLAIAAQSQAPSGDMIDVVLFQGGGLGQENTPATLKTINQSWKEQ
jgi:hypothetical protein